MHKQFQLNLTTLLSEFELKQEGNSLVSLFAEMSTYLVATSYNARNESSEHIRYQVQITYIWQ